MRIPAPKPHSRIARFSATVTALSRNGHSAQRNSPRGHRATMRATDPEPATGGSCTAALRRPEEMGCCHEDTDLVDRSANRVIASINHSRPSSSSILKSMCHGSRGRGRPQTENAGGSELRRATVPSNLRVRLGDPTPRGRDGETDALTEGWQRRSRNVGARLQRRAPRCRRSTSECQVAESSRGVFRSERHRSIHS
jgi:hypothetical protein